VCYGGYACITLHTNMVTGSLVWGGGGEAWETFEFPKIYGNCEHI
jgi:hypothetical protein